jgi:L-fuconolactonase
MTGDDGAVPAPRAERALHPAAGIVDSHVHVWDSARVEYPWLRDVPQLRGRYDLEDVVAEQALVGVDQIVLVQAADSIDDTELMLEAAGSHRRVVGVVGWVPLLRPADAAASLHRWSEHPLVGARHMVHRDSDPDLLVNSRIDDVLRMLTDRDLTFDVCAESSHLLALVPALAERHPHLTLVIDHLAKPPIRDHGWEPWAGLLRDAAKAPNVFTKLSGLNTAAEVGASAADYQPYVDHALEVFGPQRVMFGGDWPFALLAASSYTKIVAPLLGCLSGLGADDRDAVLAGTARRAYRLPAV